MRSRCGNLGAGPGASLVVGWALCVIASAAGAAEPSPAPIIVAGSGSNLPITHLLVEAFVRARPNSRIISLRESIGSTGAIRAVVDGAVAIGLVSRPLRPPEQALRLTVLPYALTAVVIGAHPAVPDAGITSDDLVRIYEGTKMRWTDGRDIVVLTREPGDSSIEVLEHGVPGFKAAYARSLQASRWTVVLTDQEMNRLLARTPSAIGLSDVGAITTDRLPVKILALDGVLPTPDNVSSGKYRLVKRLAFVFARDRLPAAARAFMDFALSPEADKIVRGAGYLPRE